LAYWRLDGLLRNYPKKTRPMSLLAPEGNLDLENVMYMPEGGKNIILQGITFQLKKADILGIIGKSASGKSSLAKVMIGVWKANGGSVRLDGADISLWNRDELGRYIGYLPQDVELFDGTISENIARFGPIDSEKVIEAALVTGIHQMILSLPKGYDTLIGEGGHILSGGQNQLIGLARALYDDPVFIVLDEPNSSLDDDAEYALQEALQEMKSRGSTIVLITHRPNILAITDKLLVINKGKLHMFGPRDKVMDLLRGQTNAESDEQPNDNESSDKQLSNPENN